MNGDQNMRTSTAIPTGLISRLDARTLVIESMAHADLDDRKARWFLFLDQQGDRDVYDEREVRAWIEDASRPGTAQSTQITLDDARELVKTYLTSDEERQEAWDEFLDMFGDREAYDADEVREWLALDDEEPEPVERPQIDDAWQIAVGSNRHRIHRIAFIGRLHHRWHAHVSYLHPEVFGEANVAQHVTTLRGFRTPDEAIDAAHEFAVEQDRGLAPLWAYGSNREGSFVARCVRVTASLFGGAK